ncbi:MAG: hypothetical protein K2U26_07890 [Cyclobacteriaceae bacterium]|nr:hypothetical protein [Cyclobacteriaceae bacterium]
MMKKTTLLFLLGVLGIALIRCDSDDVGSPPAPSFTVDKTTGLANDTEFTFTVNQVTGTGSISLLPYGEDFPNKGGVLIKASQFTNGQAVVRFTYADVGTFNAVALTSNFSSDGKSVKRSKSAVTAVTIGSNLSAITDFSFEKSTETVISETAKTIAVTVPFGTDLTALKAKFTASLFSTVRVGSTVQKSEETANNFSSPVTYVVTANNGTSTTYTVTVTVTPVETLTTVKSFQGKAISKATNNAVYKAFVDNTLKRIVILAPYQTASTALDSVRVSYSLDGKFAKMNFGAKELKQDSLLDMRTSKSVVVVAENGTSVNYTVFAVSVPKLDLSFNSPPNTSIIATTQTGDFAVSMRVLKTDPLPNLTSVTTNSTITSSSGVTVTSIKAGGSNFVSGNAVGYSVDAGVSFDLSVSDTNLGITYTVTYTASIVLIN